jgi:hypothetical protein
MKIVKNTVHVLKNRAITLCGVEYQDLMEDESWISEAQWGQVKHDLRCWECAAIMLSKNPDDK